MGKSGINCIVWVYVYKRSFPCNFQQADNFTNSLGVLQQSANPTPFKQQQQQQQQQQQSNEDHTNLFSQLIARTAKDIELLIDSLPSEESKSELQAAALRKLEAENEEAAAKLKSVVDEGEATLKEIQSALHDLAKAQLEIQKLSVLWSLF